FDYTEPSVHICPRAAVSSSVEKGRHLVAVGRISAGEVILRERPFSCVLLPGRCHRCLAETLRPVPCGGCSYSRYCSPGCRTDAWEEHHRWECPQTGTYNSVIQCFPIQWFQTVESFEL
uniref:SET and MYND domain containing 4 n=1 Tax=Salarias fasciatus TaxID=181472 RepID=A0A672GAV4_SALFA